MRTRRPPVAPAAGMITKVGTATSVANDPVGLTGAAPAGTSSAPFTRSVA